MAWTTHTAKVHASVVMGDRGSLELIARVRFKYSPGRPATPPAYSHGGLPADPAEVDAVEVIGLWIDHGGGKHEPMPLVPGLYEWIAETADHDELAQEAEEDWIAERDAGF